MGPSNFLAKYKRLNYIEVVRRGLRAGAWDVRPNALYRRHETVMRPTFVPFSRKAARIFLHEIDGVRVVMVLILYSSLILVPLGRPLLPMSLDAP